MRPRVFCQKLDFDGEGHTRHGGCEQQSLHAVESRDKETDHYCSRSKERYAERPDKLRKKLRSKANRIGGTHALGMRGSMDSSFNPLSQARWMYRLCSRPSAVGAEWLCEVQFGFAVLALLDDRLRRRPRLPF